MRKILVVLVVMVLCAAGYLYAQGQAAAPATTNRPLQFGGISTEVGTALMKVEAINKDTRMVTLKNEQGALASFKCGPEVRNFAQIQVGDKVKIQSVKSVRFSISAGAASPTRVDTVEVERAPLGQKPAGVVTTNTEALTTVESIDYINRIVTLKGAQQTVSIKVDKSAPNFELIKKGDTVHILVTEQLAIAVEK